MNTQIVQKNVVWVVPGQTCESVEMFKPWKNVIQTDLFTPFFDVEQILCHIGKNNNTFVSQLSILIYVTTAMNYIRDRLGFSPFHISAGLSVGEWLALMLIGKISVKNAIHTVTQRASCMHEYSVSSQGGMYALLGLDSVSLLRYIRQSGIDHVYLSGCHTNTHVILSGLYKSLDLFITYLRKEKCKFKYVNLNAAGPFHTPLMIKSADMFNSLQVKMNIEENERLFIDGRNGDSTKRVSDIVNYMKHQIVNPNSWRNVVNNYQSLGITHQIEISPKPVLTKLTKRISPSMNCYCIQSPECVKKIIKLTQGKCRVF
ncbi:acyltransferase domain-containing protein [Chlamydiia bacterium]|nr:acyltransferase domain-containing protein [Chlamydiia bacterium]